MDKVTVSMEKLIKEIAPQFGIDRAWIERSAHPQIAEKKDFTLFLNQQYEVLVPWTTIEEYFKAKKPEITPSIKVDKPFDFGVDQEIKPKK